MATVSVLSRIRKMHFTLNYWAFIFPIVGLTIALFQIGNALDSACIKAVCSAMSILLVALWLFVATMNIRALWLEGALAWDGRGQGGHRRAFRCRKARAAGLSGRGNLRKCIVRRTFAWDTRISW